MLTVTLPACSPVAFSPATAKTSAFITTTGQNEGQVPPVARSIYEQRAIHRVLKPFFRDLLAMQEQMQSYEKAYNLLVLVQKRIRAKLRTRWAKLEVLDMCWDQQLHNFNLIANKKNN